MKTNSFSLRTLLAALLAVVLMSVVFEACKKADNPVVVPVDKSKLKARLDSANALFLLTQEGVQVGQFEVGSKAVAKTAIDAATAVNANANATQSDVNNAYVNLGQAATVFLSKRVQEIAPEKLVLYLKMDGDAKDASGKGFNGVLMPGTAWGGGLPVLTKDRYGVDGKAYRFNKGSNIEIPYNSVLNPGKEITVSLWAQMDSSWANNYMVSLNRWNGYKLQLQSSSKVFFTVKAATSLDRDDATAGNLLFIKKWYHITTSYKSGTMNFYIDGALVKTWTDATGDPAPVKSNINLVIGQDLPNSSYDFVNKDNNADGNNFFKDYGGYFIGALDEVRIYNVALSDTQVKSIYNAEKP